MCVILVGKVSRELHLQALEQNGDGFSVFTESLGLIKAPTQAQVKKALGEFGIWHYRIGTSGKKTTMNIHPFKICGGKYLLYHNGVLGDGLGDKSDTHALADMLMNVDIRVANSVISSLADGNRFLIANAENPKVFKLFGKWEASAGVLLSHKMYTYNYYKGYVPKYKKTPATLKEKELADYDYI